MKKRKIKLMIVSAVCGLAMAVPVMAWTIASGYYALGSNQAYEVINQRFSESYIYINTRPTSGGDVSVRLEGAVTGNSLFPYNTSRSPWKVKVDNHNLSVKMTVTAFANGAFGELLVKDAP